MNIFDYAIEMEKDGEQFYRDLANKTNNPGFKSILNMLADDEVKHREILEKMKDTSDTEMEETKILSASKNIFQQIQDDKVKIISKDEEIDLYREAREIEKKSIDFYNEKIKEVDSNAEKTVLKKIADEEKRHYHLIDNIIDLLLRPKQWIETGEFIHLEDY
ncbi:MAG: ferritin family protein [Fidelibacterota bacterium]